MCPEKRSIGKPVKLLIDHQGYPDGRLVLFEIWRKKGGQEERVDEVYGVTRNGSGIGVWQSKFEESQKTQPLKKELEENIETEMYYFVAKIDDKQTKSANMIFTYPLSIYLEDDYGDPIDEAEYIITFSDGSKIEGLSRNGYVKVEEAPAGSFKLELKEYKFIFEK